MGIEAGSHMAYNTNAELWSRIKEMNEKGVDEFFSFDRNGLRLAIAAIEDETNELYEEWRNHKRMLGNARDAIRHELMDIAACAIIAYMEAE